MMGVRFDASSRTEVLERIFRERAPRRHTAKLEGPASAISAAVYFVAFEGKLVEAKAGHRTDIDALTVLALADGGEIESTPDARPTREAARFPDGIGLYRQAAANAAEIQQLLAPLGGIGAVPASDVDRLLDQLGQIPDAANVVLRLVDGRSTTAEVLARSPHDLRLTARILNRLAISEIVVPPGTVAPEPIEEASLVVAAPPAEAIDQRVREWLEHEDPSESPAEDAFTAAFAEKAPERMLTPKPGTRAPLPERPPSDVASRVRKAIPADEDDEFFRAAGVGKRTSPATWIALVLAGALLGVIVGLLLREDEPPPPRIEAPVAMLVEESETASTSTTTTSTIGELLPDGRPPIAGPDAPEDVKRAERLLNAGRYQEARELLDQLRVTRANDATVWILSGQVEVDVGRLAEAEALADRALELDPKSYRGWVLKGSVLQFRGRFQPARSAYEKALALEPNHPMTAEIQSVLEGLEKSINR